MKSQRETVVVIHGLGGKRLWMAPLSYRLSRRYDVKNWSYFSYGGSIENHAARFAKFIEERWLQPKGQYCRSQYGFDCDTSFSDDKLWPQSKRHACSAK